ncbi:sensor histidine kinase [Saccharopolyspora sp. NPDC002578]
MAEFRTPLDPPHPVDRSTLRWIEGYAALTQSALALIAGFLPLQQLLGERQWSGGDTAKTLLLVVSTGCSLWLLGRSLFPGKHPRRAHIRVIGTVAALIFWAFDGPVAESAWISALPIAVGIITWVESEQSWRAAVVRIAAGCSLVVLVGVAAGAGSGRSIAVAGMGAGICAGLTTAVLCQNWVSRLVLTLDQLRAVSADLAVARERLRFAGDLHDIQGQHLQVIALEAGLLPKLLAKDPDAAVERARRLQSLATAALDEMHAVVHDYRAVHLAEELANAVRVLESAGVGTRIDGSAEDIPESIAPMFGLLIREGVTNIIRHSRGSSCSVTISAQPDYRVTILNDGVSGGVEGAGPDRGIAGLQDRFAELGGTVRHRCRNGREHELSGMIPAGATANCGEGRR